MGSFHYWGIFKPAVEGSHPLKFLWEVVFSSDRSSIGVSVVGLKKNSPWALLGCFEAFSSCRAISLKVLVSPMVGVAVVQAKSSCFSGDNSLILSTWLSAVAIALTRSSKGVCWLILGRESKRVCCHRNKSACAWMSLVSMTGGGLWGFYFFFKAIDGGVGIRFKCIDGLIRCLKQNGFL